MQIKLLVGRAGVDFSQNRGDVIDVEEAQARRMIAAEQAVEVGAEPRADAVQKAVKAAKTEKAVK
jgi:hypothetical protein